eukprot:TRINITY_DN16526_c0_g1_i3.p4 TRINITY_DN16526_c0_g1~~TRINITY_DN16526_c0_g1_i3.p4  ORF type:complete len:365 (-),score=24.75 TRINITY_DN16526_c0_g1_i3:3310-4404(-)
MSINTLFVEMNQLLQLVQEINSQSFLFLNDDDVEQIRERAHNPSIYKPSGARGSEQGVSDERQGILSAQLSKDGFCVVLKITMLAAGFVVGPHGSTIRTVCELNGSKSISWCQTYGDGQLEHPLDIRVCLIKGPAPAIYRTIQIIRAAVQRYQDLVLGKCDEKVVRAEQIIEGITFVYKPPPSKAMPESARIASRKSKKNRKNGNVNNNINSISKKGYSQEIPIPSTNYKSVLPPPSPYSYPIMHDTTSSDFESQGQVSPKYISQGYISPYNSMNSVNSAASVASFATAPLPIPSQAMYNSSPSSMYAPITSTQSAPFLGSIGNVPPTYVSMPPPSSPSVVYSQPIQYQYYDYPNNQVFHYYYY